jgi:hypothetical protein
VRITTRAPGRVEPVHRLVEDQQLGVGEQAARHAEPLAHAERVRLDAVIGAVREADARQGAVDARVRRALAGGGDDLEVLAAGEERVRARLLDDRADAGERLRTPCRHVEAEQSHRAGGGACEPEQHADERGLAGAVRPEVAERRAGGDAQVDVVDRDTVAEALREPFGLDDP